MSTKRPDLDGFVPDAFYVHHPSAQLVTFEGWTLLPDGEPAGVFRYVDVRPANCLIAHSGGYENGERFQALSNDAAEHFG